MSNADEPIPMNLVSELATLREKAENQANAIREGVRDLKAEIGKVDSAQRILGTDLGQVKSTLSNAKAILIGGGCISGLVAVFAVAYLQNTASVTARSEAQTTANTIVKETVAGLKLELVDRVGSINSAIQDLRKESKAEIDAVRTELAGQIAKIPIVAAPAVHYEAAPTKFLTYSQDGAFNDETRIAVNRYAWELRQSVSPGSVTDVRVEFREPMPGYAVTGTISDDGQRCEMRVIPPPGFRTQQPKEISARVFITLAART